MKVIIDDREFSCTNIHCYSQVRNVGKYQLIGIDQQLIELAKKFSDEKGAFYISVIKGGETVLKGDHAFFKTPNIV